MALQASVSIPPAMTSAEQVWTRTAVDASVRKVVALAQIMSSALATCPRVNLFITKKIDRKMVR